MKKLLIKNGTIVNADEVIVSDILAVDGIIEKIDNDIVEDDAQIIDATGKYVLPGLVDLHVHLREPGQEYKEDIESGSKAAAHGGFTRVACMPNTNPVCDNAVTVSYIVNRAKEVGLTKVHPIGAATKGLEGNQLAEIGKMKKFGAVAISDDGKPVSTAQMVRLVMEYADDFNIKLHAHCEDKSLTADGVVNEGTYSTFVGLKGICNASESVAVEREISIAEAFNKSVHICHVSTKESIDAIRRAKERGVKVTAETCPHYFTLNDSVVMDFSTATKVNPPIRAEIDRLAVIEGLRDGTIDAIATDHAPHHVDDKDVEYAYAAFGITGLETSFTLSYTKLVKENGFTLPQLVKLMSKTPSEIIGVDGGVIECGKCADFAIVDLDAEWVIDKTKFYSKGKNTPFDGYSTKGKVYCTVLDGKVVHKEDEIYG